MGAQNKKEFVEAYVDWAAKVTHAPEIFHHYVAFWILSTALRNRVWMKQGPFRVYPNLWMILVAGSSWYGKSTSLRLGQTILERAVPDCFYPDEFSHENLIKNLSQKPQGAFLFSEFRSFMKMLDREYMGGTKSLLTDLFDCPPRRRRTVGVKEEREYIIENPVVNIGAATTVDWFVDSIKDKDLLSGFLPRFLFIPAHEQDRFYALQPPSDPETENELVSQLQGLAAVQGECAFEKDSKAAYEARANAFYKANRAGGSLCHPFYPRLINYALKFSILNCVLSDNFPVIRPEDVERAWDTVEHLAGYMKRIIEHDLTFTPEESKLKSLREFIRDRYPKAVSWSELLRHSKLLSRDLWHYTASLVQAGEVTETVFDQDGPGRKPRIFTYNTERLKDDAVGSAREGRLGRLEESLEATDE
jgi:hypothetical protein